MGAHHSNESSLPSSALKPSETKVREEPMKLVIKAPSEPPTITNGAANGGAKRLQLVKSKLLDLPTFRLTSPGSQQPQQIGAAQCCRAASSEPLDNRRLLPAMDPLERRRKSIQDGDVFIYPSHYKDQNVCHKCKRDNRICSCSSTSSSLQELGQIEVSDGDRRRDESYAANEMPTQKVQSDETPISSSDTTSSSYKISIATALIDQKNNQLRLSTPRIIVSKRFSNGLNNEQPMEQTITTSEPVDVQQEQVESPVTMIEACAVSASPRRVEDHQESNPSSISLLNDEEEQSEEVVKAKVTSISVGNPTENPNIVSNLKKLLPSATSTLLDQNNNNENQALSIAKEELMKRRMEEIVREEKEAGEEQLTCNFSVDDAIKITSTSIRIGTSHLPPLTCVANSNLALSVMSSTTTSDNTSVVPIGSQSRRRRDLAAHRLSRQAIHEDDVDGEHEDQIRTVERPMFFGADLRASNEDQNRSNNSSLGDQEALEYSPILSSVRDYIKNVNTELQVQTTAPSALVELCGAELPTVATVADVTATLLVRPFTLSSHGELLVSPSLLTTTTMATTTSTTSASKQQEIAATNCSTANNLCPISGTESGSNESPKKSIFEGASKDEILEYLEDARERVPDILMAADDVMVIGDNELIVVNQLEPNSPATPISIVETVKTVLNSSAQQNCQSAAPVDLNLVDVANHPEVEEDVVGQPERLRQHLQQMYQQSRLRSGFPSGGSTSGDNNNTDDEMLTPALTTFGSSLDEAAGLVVNQGSGKPLDNLNLEAINKPQETISKEMQQLNFVTSSSLLFAGGRRNSASSEGTKGGPSGSGSNVPGQCHRLAATMTQLMRQHQRYPNQRDSLSSPSSSPPSSTSPSSTSSSSQQTSGNCSAASTFYASSSLSCSSPLLAALGVASPPLESRRVDLENTEAQRNLSMAAASPASELTPQIANGQLMERGDSGLGSADYTRARGVAAYFDTSTTTQSSKDVKPTATEGDDNNKLSVIEETIQRPPTKTATISADNQKSFNLQVTRLPAKKKTSETSGNNLVTRSLHGHYATINRLNNYFMNRHPFANTSETTVEFQCLDCDQFIDVDQATMMNKSNELRMLRGAASMELETTSDNNSSTSSMNQNTRKESLMTADQLDRAYIAAMNGLPLCKSCEKKRVERKEIISEFVETELKYGRDLKIIFDEFYRPMQIAGLLSKDNITSVFLNLEELIMAHCKFADRLQTAIKEAHGMGDTDYNTLNIGRLFIESSEMLSTFESYCIRQGSAACLLARLAKEKELLRVFLRVSQMENTLLRRMNLAAFLMVPVQRVTKYPLLLNRLYKVTAYHHKDRELLRDAQLKVELHLEHINQQTKGLGATNKIWRRISNLSTPISSSRRGLINAEDIGYIKLRKTAMDMLKWDRDETQFIHSEKLNFAPLNEFLTKQKMKPMRYMAAHALLIVSGKPNWKYRPDLVKSNLDSKLMTPTPGGNGIRDAALLLFREKNGRFIPCREPLFLKNCVLSADCSQFNSECPSNQPTTLNSHGANSTTSTATNTQSSQIGPNKETAVATKSHPPKAELVGERKSNSSTGADTISMASVKSLPEERSTGAQSSPSTSSSSPPPPPPSSRSNSLASALPRTLSAALASPVTAATTTASSTCSLNQTAAATIKSSTTTTPGCAQPTIINQLMTKVNQSYHNHKQHQNGHQPNANSKFAISSPEPMLPINQSRSFSVVSIAPSSSHLDLRLSNLNQSTHTAIASITSAAAAATEIINRRSSTTATCGIGSSSGGSNNSADIHQHYNHLFFHNHHQPYGDYEESFELHEVVTKESLLLRADTPLKTRYWLQMLRYHAKDMGQWRGRRNGLANIMMMRQE